MFSTLCALNESVHFSYWLAVLLTTWLADEIIVVRVILFDNPYD